MVYLFHFNEETRKASAMDVTAGSFSTVAGTV